MSNRNFASGGKIYSMHVMPVIADLSITIGAAGAVASSKGTLLKSVTRLAQGVYSIKLKDNYNRYLSGWAQVLAPVTGSSVPAASLSAGTLYTITAVGTTDWIAVGVSAGMTPAVGMSFVATGAGSGTGTAKAVGASGVQSIEVAGDPNTTMSPSAQFIANKGAEIIIITVGPTSSSDTTPIAVDPAAGSTLLIAMELSNSSVILPGE